MGLIETRATRKSGRFVGDIAMLLAEVMMTEAIGPYSTATDMLAALRAKQISSLELTNLLLTRIEEHDGPLNAIPVRTPDHAREAARNADAALAQGEWRALLGLPITLKESTQTAGLPRATGLSPPACSRRGRVSSARPISPRPSPIGRPTARYTDAPITRGISLARRAAARAAAARDLPRG